MPLTHSLRLLFALTKLYAAIKENESLGARKLSPDVSDFPHSQVEGLTLQNPAGWPWMVSAGTSFKLQQDLMSEKEEMWRRREPFSGETRSLVGMAAMRVIARSQSVPRQYSRTHVERCPDIWSPLENPISFPRVMALRNSCHKSK